MKMRKKTRFAIIGAIVFAAAAWMYFSGVEKTSDSNPWRDIQSQRVHLNHAAFFTKPFQSPRDVTAACLQCHDAAARELMATAHWTWLGEPVLVQGHKEPMRIGKKNLLNNFCIGIQGNWASCTSCHAGYGWGDESFDFSDPLNVDCLVCHDWSGSYVKGDKGLPEKGTDLLASARSVGYPKRDNCGICHIYGGGGMGVKHGDLDNTLINAPETLDIHIGGHNLLCIDCHRTQRHNIKGRAFSVGVSHENGIGCTDCHNKIPHRDRRINSHLKNLACPTCHLPSFARKAPTKTYWDWSKAGDGTREEDPHHYLKIKGEFVYDKNIVPEYHWFNLKAFRYILGDKINPAKPTDINKPMGDIRDEQSKIWPFKIHRATLPYDLKYLHLLQPVTSGAGGFWHEFEWNKALELGARITGVKYSGQYAFTQTVMYWPLAHMIAPSNKALMCEDCHTNNSRFNWKALGYKGDPIRTGGRYGNGLVKAESSEGGVN